MSAKNTNSVMGAKGRYLEAMQRADARDVARAATKDRAAKRAALRAQTSSSPAVQPTQPITETNVPVNGIKAAQGEENQPQPKLCICHGDRPIDSHGLCKPSVDSARWVGRVAADTNEDAVEMVQKIIDSGVIKRAATKAELLQRKEARGTAERGTASALKDVANANGKPVVLTPKPDLPEGVSFVDPKQGHYFAKCAVLRGLNFQLAAKDAYPLLTPFEHSVIASVAERDQNIRAAIEIEASQRGLGESDKKIFVGLLWRQALSTKPSEYIAQGNAMRILSKVFIEGQQQPQTPARLEISGIDEGLKKMFGSNFDKLKELQQPVTMPDISENDFDADEEGK